ncbi:NAD-dependent succinate-semialdehyde dehydrogenase [Magnetovibrio sp.]|uniref:NAD-dependent succinate-semialdehyde dehydrogenase n=1 Tax=Magnetovibrio sp. TaxID=2024836 RepID=UPI002F94FC37
MDLPANLIFSQAFIDGLWTDSANGATYPITNPATGEVIATVPDMGRDETARAIAAAEKARPAWAAQTAKTRAAILRTWFDLIMGHQEELAKIVTLECGKPLGEARGEVAYGASFIEWFGEEAKRLYGEVIPSPAGNSRIVTLRQPIGVAAAITPWNFPLAMITRKCAPALAAGCPVVVKPSEDTPLTALALAALAHKAGFPAGTFNIVTASRGAEVGLELCENPIVRKLSFTGSTPVGKILMRQCADTVTKVSLELGGNAPFIVFDDADVDAAVEGALASKYRNAGQTCVCANRFLVQSGVYDEFAQKMAAAVASFKVGNGLEDGVTQGPLINAKGLAKVEELVDDALAHGAKALSGGAVHALGGTYYEPTVLTDVTPEMRIANEEIFGPVAPLYRFETEEDAVRIANDTPYGLAGYFYSRDIGRVWRVAEALEYGILGINEGIFSTEVAPFGGVKESGIGREGGKQGIEEYTEIKYLRIGGL